MTAGYGRLNWLIRVCTILCIFFLFGQPILADSLDIIAVDATVPGQTPPDNPITAVVFKGIAYPSSTVTILKNGELAAAIPADPQARFDVTISNLTAGTYTFSVSGTDKDGRQGPAQNFAMTLTTGTTVTITGIFLGPTIEADKTQARLGETITLLGVTSPSSTVSVYVSSETQHSFDVTADGSGAWSKQFQANDLKIGNHEAKSKATDPDGSVSEFSNIVSFQIATSEKCADKTKADLNCDGQVDLIDFSILLYYWNQTKPANARADINTDNMVNIIDFSIMLYYWTGAK
jgi:hypothetical protein